MQWYLIDKLTKNISIRLKGGTEIIANRALSPPVEFLHIRKTGSTGDGFKWLKRLTTRLLITTLPLCLSHSKTSGRKTKRINLERYQAKRVFKRTETEKFRQTRREAAFLLIFERQRLDGFEYEPRHRRIIEGGEIIIALDLFPKLDHGAPQKASDIACGGEQQET